MRVVDADGNGVARYRYDPYGNLIYSTGDLVSINPLRYRGYYYDSETGFYYLQSRYYDPEIGRFLNADTFIDTDAGLQGYNLFTYCGNNPICRIDVSGTDSEKNEDLDLVDDELHALGGGNMISITPPTPKTGFLNVLLDTVDDLLKSFSDGLNGLWGVFRGTPNNPQCFVSGTLVKTESGEIPIEEIRTGDLVWAWDEETGDVALKEVVETYVNQTDELIHVFVNGEEIISTPSHPFYSPVKGWTSAVHLRAGDILVLVNGEYVVVEKIQHEILEAPVTVYNFQVEDYHTYYVADTGVLVHNMCAETPGLPKNGTVLETNDALTLAEDYLGPGYKEASPGRFVSSDGKRQVRLGDKDLLGTHAGGPHINFDRLYPRYKKAHVFFRD